MQELPDAAGILRYRKVLGETLNRLMSEDESFASSLRIPAVQANRRTRLAMLLLEQVAGGDFDDVLEQVSPEQLAARFEVAAGHGAHAAAQAVGPVFTAAGLAQWKGVSKEALRKAQKAGRLLGFKSADGVLLYPQFQLNEYGEYLPHLKEVLAVIDPNRVDDGGSAVWLNRPFPSLGGRTAAQALWDGDVEAVLDVAREIEWVWQTAS